MQNLLIEQRGPQGLVKTWRLHPDQGSVSFGQSKHADLRSPLGSVLGIQGAFEFRDGAWIYLNLDPSHSAQGPDEICLNTPQDLQFGDSALSVVPLLSRQPLFLDIENADFMTAGPEKSPFQLVAVYSGGQLLETKILRLGEIFCSEYDQLQTKFVTSEATHWQHTKLANLEITQRTIYLSNVEALKVISSDQLIDVGGKKTLFATLAGAALLALLFLLSPSAKNAEEVAIASAPPQEYREIKLSPPKKKKQSAPAPAPQHQTQATATATSSASAPQSPGDSGGGKAVSAIKALGQSRISQLIGKISAGAAKSSNVVVTAGVVAGTAPSGRALAAVGGVTQSGHDYVGDGSGKGIKVATVGHGGGGSAAGLGSISGGKAGSGGVGLLEEDGEVTGGLDREVIAAYIRSKLGEILYCYERQLSAQPDLYGKVAVKFAIGSSGAVETQRVGETTLKNSTVEGCILQRVSKWKFPTPDGGTKVMVTYPFLFKSTN